MFAALGRTAARHRWWVSVLALAFVLFSAVWGTGVFRSLTGGAGFDDPGSESSRADTVLAGDLGRHAADVVALYEVPPGTGPGPVDDPAVAAGVRDAAARAAADSGAVTRVESFASTGDPAFVSVDRRATYVTIQLTGADDQARVGQFTALQDRLQVPGTTVRFGGLTPMTAEVNASIGQDIARAEIVSVPILLVLLVLIFGSVVSALLPLAVAAVVVMGSFAMIRVVTLFTDVSTFAVNVVTILGLGLAIDYGLFVVTRFREELAGGRDVEDAIAATSASAGRTVAFSGLTVAASLACLTLFPARFLSSMGYAGVAVVLFAVLATLVVLPALLRFTGRRVDALAVPRPLARRGVGTPAPVGEGRWYRVARRVMRRPVLVTVGLAVVLVGLGSPVLGANWARPGDWVLPPDADARAVTDQMQDRFVADPARTMTVVLQRTGRAPATAPDGYLARLDAVPGVTSARVTGQAGGDVRITLGYRLDPQSAPARDMVDGLRAVPAPEGASALLTGMPASRVDIVAMITDRLPAMVLAVALISVVVMFLAFGSLLLPIKAVLLNLLSLSAAFGAITLIFQDGLLSGLLGFVPVGAVDIDFPVLIVAIAFGLAMDYEVFLLSRIRERWERTGDVEESVAAGVQRTATIITGAALLMLVVVGGFVLSSVTLMKMVGVGMVVAVVVDVTVVRALMVPATMRLLGRWAWWAPAPLARWWERHGIREAGEAPPPAGTGPEPAGNETAGAGVSSGRP